MSATPSVRFAPVSAAVSAAGTAVAGVGTAAKSALTSAEGGGLDGLFASLLALLDAAEVTPGGQSSQTSTTSALPGALGAITTSASLTSTSPFTESGAGASGGPKSILQELSDALAGVELAVENGTPVSMALRKKLGDTVDALAGLLGITFPTPTTLDPQTTVASAASGAVAPGDALNVLAALAATRRPNAEKTADGAPSGPASPADQSTVPQDGSAPFPDKAPTSAALAQLSAKIEQISTALAQTAPDLAKKLDALAQTLDASSADDVLKTLGLHDGLKPLEQKLDAALASLTGKPVTTSASARQQLSAPASMPSPAATQDARTDDTTANADPAAGSDRKGLEAAPTTKLVVNTNPGTEEKSDGAGSGGAGGQSSAQPQAIASTAAADTSAAVAPTPTSDQPSGLVATAVQQTNGIAPMADARAAQAAYQPAPQVPYPQVAFEIARQFAAGNSKFQIRLDPPELGRIDVKLDVDKHGTVTARMTVEKSETLDLMQRDQRSLEKALAQAGLDSGKTNLQFSLRQNPSGGGPGGGQPQADFGTTAPAALADTAPEQSPISLYRAAASGSGINLFV